jgi:DeoR/GlpR family transcriptional regulator of sugar metabolism
MAYKIQFRQQKILELLAGKEQVTVSELGKILNVSEVTIRTDLNNLVKLGKIDRTHGGAYLTEERLKQEYTFHARKSINFSKKQKIGALASAFVNSSECLLFDASSTVLALAQVLKKKSELKDITVIPTGIWTAIELMGCSNINVLLPGGYLRHTSGSITGLPTNGFLSDMLIQKAFLGAWGISLAEGLTDINLVEIELKKFIISRSREIIVLVDGSKFRQIGLKAYAGLNQISRIITDSSAPPEEIEKLRNAGVEVLVAN